MRFPLYLSLCIQWLWIGCNPSSNYIEPAPASECYKYVRDDYGYPTDLDDDCQNTRGEVLIKQSLIVVTFTTPSNCTVANGKWVDPYSGDTVLNASELQIDHLVPLSEANKSGASAWTLAEKKAFGNDPENLVPTTAALNSQKEDFDPGAWLPPRKEYVKTYCERFAAVKRKYQLTVDERELAVLRRYMEPVGLVVGAECFGVSVSVSLINSAGSVISYSLGPDIMN